MRPLIFIVSSILFSQAAPPPANGTPPPNSKKAGYQEQRAELLRAIGELRAKVQALELELQLLDEERASAPEPSPANPTAWRETTTRPDGRRDEQILKKASTRCAAFTGNGKRCTRSAEAGSKFCWQHRH